MLVEPRLKCRQERVVCPQLCEICPKGVFVQPGEHRGEIRVESTHLLDGLLFKTGWLAGHFRKDCRHLRAAQLISGDGERLTDELVGTREQVGDHHANIVDGDHLPLGLGVDGDAEHRHTVHELWVLKAQHVFHKEGRADNTGGQTEFADVLFDDIFGVEVRHALTAISPADRAVDEMLYICPFGSIGHEAPAPDFRFRTLLVERQNGKDAVGILHRRLQRGAIVEITNFQRHPLLGKEPGVGTRCRQHKRVNVGKALRKQMPSYGPTLLAVGTSIFLSCGVMMESPIVPMLNQVTDFLDGATPDVHVHRQELLRSSTRRDEARNLRKPHANRRLIKTRKERVFITTAIVP